MKFKLLKIKKRTPNTEINDLVPKGVKEVVGERLPFNEMGAKQLPSSKLYTNLGE